MKRVITISKGVIASEQEVPDFSRILRGSAFIAAVPQGDTDSDIYLSETGVPMFLLKQYGQDPASLFIPEFWELDEMCSEQSYERTGQAYLITDILARDGICTYKTGGALRKLVRQNLKDRTYIVLLGE